MGGQVERGRRAREDDEASLPQRVGVGGDGDAMAIYARTSLRIPFLGELSSARRRGKAPQLMTHWVWQSSPVTTLPAVRSAGVCTEAGGWPISSTMRAQMPVSRTAWIFSLGPSER